MGCQIYGAGNLNNRVVDIDIDSNDNVYVTGANEGFGSEFILPLNAHKNQSLLKKEN